MFEYDQEVRLVRDVVYTDDGLAAIMEAGTIGKILEMRGDRMLIAFEDSTEWVDIDDVEALDGD